MLTNNTQGIPFPKAGLHAFVEGLKYSETQESTWKTWTSGDHLFTGLHGEVKERRGDVIAAAQEQVVKYEANLNDSASRTKCQKVKAILWCAAKAAKMPDVLLPLRRRRALERLRLPRVFGQYRCVLGHEETQSWGDHDWLWGGVLTFLDVPVRRSAIYIPIAAWEQASNSGFLNTLMLEVLETGTSAERASGLWHHPRDLLVTELGQDFVESMKNAWHAARKLVEVQSEQANGVLQCAARWRVLSGWTGDASDRKNLAAAPEAAGRSASAAAARGWWFALTSRVPDDRIVVIGQIDHRYRLAPVDRKAISPKVKAIIEAGCFDTIALVQDKSDLIAGAEVQKAEALDGTIESHVAKDALCVAVVDADQGMEV